MKVLEKGRNYIAAICVGVAERMLRDELAYAVDSRFKSRPAAPIDCATVHHYRDGPSPLDILAIGT